MIRLSQKSKCQGCYCLNTPSKGGVFKCAMGYEIQFKLGPDGPFAPRPGEPCYKPKNNQEAEEAESKKARNA